MVRRARPERLHDVQSDLELSEENDAEEDCTATPVAPEGLARQSGFPADCHDATASALSEDEVCP